MCGFIITNQDIKITDFKNTLKHRGPDQTGSYEHGEIKIIFNRLAIIDLSKKANQPFVYKNFIIIFNGEIYNYLELRKQLTDLGHKFVSNSDTEVLLKSYLQWKRGCLKKLEGMFSFCIYNKANRTIFVARDRYGIKPLFYFKDKNKFIISSEKKAIFDLGVKKKLNLPSILNFIYRGVYQHSKQTFFDGIYNIEPGMFATIKNGNISLKKWFNFEYDINNKIKYYDARDQLDYLIKKSIRLSLRSDKNIAVSVSGGIDSSMIINKLIEENLGSNISHLSHWTCDDENDEKYYANLLAKSYQRKIVLAHFKKKDFYKYMMKSLKHIDEPFGGLSLMASLKMCEMLKKKGVRVLLDGNGIDEILGGYGHHINTFNKNHLDYKNQPIQGLKVFFPKNILNKKFHDLIPDFSIKKKFKNYLKDVMFNDLTGSKLRRCLLQGDHISMSQSIEVRYPFLNNELVNFCFSLPNNFLIKNNFGKYIMRDLSKKPIFWQAKRPSQTPQTKWMREFILEDLIKNIKKNEIFFDNSVFNKENLIRELKMWKSKNVKNSAFPWYFLMIYHFVNKNIN